MLHPLSGFKEYYKFDTASNLDLILEIKAWRQHIPLHNLFTYKTTHQNPVDQPDNPHSKNLNTDI
jgi:hypothetical protein